MAKIRYCKNENCKTMLVKRDGEMRKGFAKRLYCSKNCVRDVMESAAQSPTEDEIYGADGLAAKIRSKRKFSSPEDRLVEYTIPQCDASFSRVIRKAIDSRG